MRQPATMAGLTSKKGWVRIRYDQSVWIPVLPAYPDGEDARSYSAAAAEEWWQASGLPHTSVDVLRLFHILVEGTREHLRSYPMPSGVCAPARPAQAPVAAIRGSLGSDR
jgi:hypothetical protein